MIRIAVLFALLLAVPAWGQGILATGSLGTPGDLSGGHAWLVVPNAGGGVTILHVPPRDAVVDGVVRVAGEVRNPPVSIAGLGTRLYLVFEAEPVGPAFVGVVDPHPRPVLSLNAVEFAKGRWTSEPMGRLDARPSVPGRGTLLGIAASDVGLFAALRVDQRIEVLRLDKGEWRVVHEEGEGEGETRLFGTLGGIGLLQGDAERTRVGVLSLTADGAPMGDMEWRVAPHPAWWNAMAASGQIVLWERGTNGTLTMLGVPSASPDAPWRTIGEVASVGNAPAVAALDADARVLIAWAATDSLPRRGLPGELELREVSVSSGRVFYQGQAKLANPVAGADLAVLSVLLVVLVGSIGVTVWRPRESAVVLPKEASVAEAPRRAIAGLIDLGIAVSLSAIATGAASGDLLSGEWWATASGHGVILRALAALVLCGTSLEALAGRTPGKMLTGIRVVTVQAGEHQDEWRRPTFRQALIRNIIKWGLPPVGLMALFEPSGRARADQFAGTAAVIPTPTEDDDE